MWDDQMEGVRVCARAYACISLHGHVYNQRLQQRPADAMFQTTFLKWK